jgi:signal transduction histidine kinase
MLWFLTENGAAIVDPREVRVNHAPPLASIERISADDRILDPAPHLELGPRISRIQIEYTAPSLGGSAKVRFRYKLEGFDSEWMDAGIRRQAFYTNLPPGNYLFRVSAENNGVWNQSDATWEFSVRPTFYQTVWFYLICASAAALTVLCIWRLRVRRIHEQYALVLAERTRLGRELHDTLLQGLFGLGLQFDAIMQLIESSPSAAKARLEHARSHVEQYIRETRHSIWNLRSPSFNKSDFVSALQLTGESLAVAANIRFKLTVKGRPWHSTVVEEQLLRISQEAISNAVRHADATEIRVDVSYERNLLRLRVVDNGRGIVPQEPQNVALTGGWGMANMRERAQQIGGRLTVTSLADRGTELELILSRT